jgi:hypothetical protein
MPDGHRLDVLRRDGRRARGGVWRSGHGRLLGAGAVDDRIVDRPVGDAPLVEDRLVRAVIDQAFTAPRMASLVVPALFGIAIPYGAES